MNDYQLTSSQQVAVDALITQLQEEHYCLNLSEPGCGKTLMTLAIIDHFQWRKEAVLVVCPKTVIGVWQKHGITAINYEQLDKVLDNQYVAVVFDEIHKCKTRQALVSKRAYKVAADYRIGLTGTPVLNKPNDLWSILNTLHCFKKATKKSPGQSIWMNVPVEQLKGSVGGSQATSRLNSYWTFVYSFCDLEITQYAETPVGITRDPQMADLLGLLLQACSVRLEFEQVQQQLAGNADIPELRMSKVKLLLTEEEAALYNDIKKLTLADAQMWISNALVQSLRLRQLTENCYRKLEYAIAAAHQLDKVVIFCTFIQTGEALLHCIEDAVPDSTALLFTGQLTTAERQVLCRKFVAAEKAVLIGTYRALGTGLDGLQTVCSDAILMQLPWSPAELHQALGRLHRIGQTNTVNVSLLEAYNGTKTTIDTHIQKISQMKQKSISKILSYL